MAPRGGGARSGGALPKLRTLCPKTIFFGPKRHRNPLKTAKRREKVATLHMRLDCPMTKSPLLPSNTTISQETAQKMLKMAAMCAVSVKQAQNQERAISWATWLQPNSEGTWPTRNSALFLVFNPRNRPTRRLESCTSGHFVQPEGRPAPGAKRIIFSKVVPRPLGMLQQVFLARFEPVVTHFGPWKIPKCLENGPSWDQKWVKNQSKTRFSKSDLGPFGMLKQVCLAHFELMATCFGP